MLTGKHILLLIGGGIAAYKSLDLIRRLRAEGARVRVVMTSAAAEFVTPLAAGTLAGEPVRTDLFDPASEHDVGHIRLSREADLLIVAPATADLLAKMANGFADDLASATLLASDKPVLVAPAMNPLMWSNPATRRNAERLAADGVAFVGPNAGEMAEAGEAGLGRMAEPAEILAAASALLAATPSGKGPLAGRHVLVTSGPTHEPLDPIRYLANRSSGRQGHAIAAAAAAAGARVTLVSGPVAIPDPRGVTVVKVETAADMMAAVEAALPADVAVLAAAVADWRPAAASDHKMKKTPGGAVPQLALTETPDILASLGNHHTLRPQLVVGFAAETESLLKNAKAKLKAKGCDWILANDVSPGTGVLGGEANTVHFIADADTEEWPKMKKTEVAARLVARIAEALAVGPAGRRAARRKKDE